MSALLMTLLTAAAVGQEASALLPAQRAAESLRAKIEQRPGVTRVLVAGINESSGSQSRMARALEEEVVAALVRSERIKVVERLLLDRLLRERKIEQSALYDEGTVKGLGDFVGAQILVIGSILRAGDTRSLVLRGIDLTSGKWLGVVTETLASRSAEAKAATTILYQEGVGDQPRAFAGPYGRWVASVEAKALRPQGQVWAYRTIWQDIPPRFKAVFRFVNANRGSKSYYASDRGVSNYHYSFSVIFADGSRMTCWLKDQITAGSVNCDAPGSRWTQVSDNFRGVEMLRLATDGNVLKFDAGADAVSAPWPAGGKKIIGIEIVDMKAARVDLLLSGITIEEIQTL